MESGTARATAVLDRVQIGLALIALAGSLPLRGILVVDAHLPFIVALTLGLVGYRAWLSTGERGERVRRVGFWVTAPIVFALVWMSPLFGLYAFTGYIEGPALPRGAQRWAALIVTAVSTALAQVGGPRSMLFSPPIYGLILAVNVAIAVMIALLERERERGVTKLERTVAELRAAEERNAVLQEQLVAQAREAGVLDERQRLSREIHDTVAQSLVGIITQLEAAETSGAADLGDGTERADRLARTRDTARQALGEARRAVRALASPRLDSRSLPDAVAGLVADINSSSAGTNGLDAHFVVDGDPYPSRGDAELVRICQEALANVVRHAEASRVVVTLGYDPEELRLDVRDNGVGLDLDAPTAGHGVRGMRERVGLLGGTLEIEAPEGGSCTVSVAIPR